MFFRINLEIKKFCEWDSSTVDVKTTVIHKEHIEETILLYVSRDDDDDDLSDYQKIHIDLHNSNLNLKLIYLIPHFL